MLVANKCEGRASDEGFYEAFELGLGRAGSDLRRAWSWRLVISERDCLAALGLEAEIETARRIQRGRSSTSPSAPLRVAIVGRPNAGKSTLVNCILGEDRMITGPEPGLTRDSVSQRLQLERPRR